MKKGQTETIGLLVIVVLLLVIGVVFLKFNVGNKQDLKADLRTNVQTTNLLRAVMKASLSDKSVSDAIVDCYFNSAQCSSIGNEIKKILDKSVGEGRSYSFTASADNRQLISLGTCQGLGIIASYQISKAGTFVESKLKVCDR